MVKFRYRIQTNTTIDLEDACADELKSDPVQTALLDIASWIDAKMREIIYSIKHLEHMLFDLDSILLKPL